MRISNKQLFQQLCDKLNLKIYKMDNAQYARFNFPDGMVNLTWGCLLKRKNKSLWIAEDLNLNNTTLHYSSWLKYSNKQLSKLITQREVLIKKYKEELYQKKLKDIKDDFK